MRLSWIHYSSGVSKTALLDAIKTLDLARMKQILRATPELRQLRDDRGLDLLQMAVKRRTAGKPADQRRQLAIAAWLVAEGFDPRVLHRTARGEDGEEESTDVSLAWFAVAFAQNNALTRFFLRHGAAPNALFAAVWWGNVEIVPDLVRHGADVNEVVGATPLHMAVDVVTRGTEGKPALARKRVQVIETLIGLGADPNRAAFDGTTPLHTALKKEYLQAFRLLLRHGADPDVPGKDGRTVREIAARKRDRRFREALPSQ